MNPLLYSVMSKRFRRGFRDMFKRNSGGSGAAGQIPGNAAAAAAGAAAACSFGTNSNNHQQRTNVVNPSLKKQKVFISIYHEFYVHGGRQRFCDWAFISITTAVIKKPCT